MKRAAKAWTPLKTKNNKHSVVVEFICPGVNVLHSAILGGAQEAEPARSDRYMEHSFCRGNGSLGTRIGRPFVSCSLPQPAGHRVYRSNLRLNLCGIDGRLGRLSGLGLWIQTTGRSALLG